MDRAFETLESAARLKPYTFGPIAPTVPNPVLDAQKTKWSETLKSYLTIFPSGQRNRTFGQ